MLPRRTTRALPTPLRLPPTPARRHASSPAQPLSPRALLATPSWDPASHLPTPADIASPTNRLSPAKLAHLLRLSALPLPASEAEERSLLDALAAQLHFVRQVRRADTAGVAELGAIRDETEEGDGAVLAAAREVLGREERRGEYAPRLRRGKDAGEGESGVEDPLRNAARRMGDYFVVRREQV